MMQSQLYYHVVTCLKFSVHFVRVPKQDYESWRKNTKLYSGSMKFWNRDLKRWVFHCSLAFQQEYKIEVVRLVQ